MRNKEMVTKVVVAALIVMSLGSAQAQGQVTVSRGFMNGDEFRALSYDAKLSYSMGLIDGMLGTPFISGVSGKESWLSNCMIEATNAQVVAVLDKYLEDNPAQWHHPMNGIGYSAMFAACGGAK